MEFLEKWERKLGWMSFPGLLRYYALFHVMVYLLQYLNPHIGQILEFDLGKIMSGEVWRAVTFLFSSSGMGGQGGLSLLAVYFMVVIAFLCSDGLEEAWGVFRSSMFYYAGFAGLLLANVIYSILFPVPLPGSGFFMYEAAFFAFATLFPRFELLLFFILPVQVRWLALLGVLGILISVVKAPLIIGFVILGLANYILWAGIPALRGQARVIESAGRKRKFEKTKSTGDESFHRCAKCGRTEVSDPDLEFRMAEDGKEYCEDHLEG